MIDHDNYIIDLANRQFLSISLKNFASLLRRLCDGLEVLQKRRKSGAKPFLNNDEKGRKKIVKFLL